MTNRDEEYINKERCNTLLKEALILMLDKDVMERTDWASLSLVLNFSLGQQSSRGYLYNGDGKFFTGWVSGNIDFFSKMSELRETMVEGGARPWQAALIQITRHDMDFAIEYEYDNPIRWDQDDFSISHGEYVNSLLTMPISS